MKTLFLLVTLTLSFTSYGGNALQNKYYEAKGTQCGLKGALKTLRKDYDCFININTCKAALLTLNKKVGKDIIDLYADTLRLSKKQNGGKLVFEMVPPCPDNRYYDYQVGLVGLGYAKAVQHKQLVWDLASKLQREGAIVRHAVVNAIWHMGDKSGIPVLVKLLSLEAKDNTFKAQALRYLSLWGSDKGVSYCQSGLKGKISDSVLRDACMFYLGERKVKTATSDMQRNLSKEPKTTALSMGLTGDKGAVAILEKYLKKKDKSHDVKKVAIVAALVNLGQAKYQEQLASYLKGQKVPNAKQRKKFAKKLEKADKLIARAKKRKGKSAQKQLENALKRKNKLIKKMNGFSKDILKVAASVFPFIKNSKMKNMGIKSFVQVMNDDEQKERTQFYAAMALAQVGNAQGINKLVEFMQSGKDSTKDRVVRAAGSLWANPDEIEHSGTGIIKSKKLLAEIIKHAQVETNKSKKENAIKAIANMKAAL